MNVAVVGAGVVGRLLAFRLSRAGVPVTLFDRGDWDSQAACSFAAAGLLAPLSEASHGGDAFLVEHGQAAIAAWQEISRGLPRRVTIGDRGVIAAHAPGDDGERRELAARLTSRFPGQPMQLLSRHELVELEPALAASSLAGGVLLPSEGFIQTHEALAALGEALQQDQHVTCRMRTEVLAVAAGRVATQQGEETFTAVADCRGFGARGDLKELRGVRGEIIELTAPDVLLTRPLRFLHRRYPAYLVPRSTGVYAVGATTLESESVAPVTVQAAMELMQAALHVHPGFRFAQVSRLTANCRPAYDDNLPRIEQTPGLMSINGLYRHGFLLAPDVTARAATQLLHEVKS